MDEQDLNETSFPQFTPVSTKRASEAIYEQIRTMINNGELKPGDRLPSERKMMELFKRSRPTIREALRMLERIGFIKIVPGSVGAIIQAPRNINVQQIMEDALKSRHISLTEMVEYRLISETATVTWAVARRTSEDIQAMEAFLEESRSLMHDYRLFLEKDSYFHELIAMAAKNHVSAIMNQTLSEINRDLTLRRMDLLSVEGRQHIMNRIHSQHTAIFEAIRDQDIDAARTAIITHIQGFKHDL